MYLFDICTCNIQIFGGNFFVMYFLNLLSVCGRRMENSRYYEHAPTVKLILPSLKVINFFYIKLHAIIHC